MTDNYNPGREQVQVTASPNIQSEKARFDPQGSADRLVAALGADSTQRELAAKQQRQEQDKLQEQAAKVDYYVEQFQRDHQGGAVSQAQVRSRFPETVPVIASRIAEGVGRTEGKKQFAAVVEEIARNDALRLDSTARAQFLAKKRGEIMGGIGEGNDFYGAGVVSAIDKQIAQHEANWQSETAAYHHKVQSEAFTNEVAEAITSGDASKLLDIDAKWGASSSLNNIERNKLVVDSAIDLAWTTQDASLLDAVPERFLNVDAKADLQKAKIQLIERRMSDMRMARELQETERKERERSLQLEIIGDVVDGKNIDPARYREDPDVFLFAMQMREAPRLAESASVAAAQSFRNSILTTATTGTQASLQDFTDSVVAHPGLNPKEKQALLAELPKLIEGRHLMADDMVRQPVSDRLNPRLQALESSTKSAIQTLLTGRNLRSEVMRGYDLDIRRSFMAEFEETGRWPVGHRKLELIDRAVDRAEKRLEEATKITGGSSSPGPKAPAAAAPKPAPTATPRALPRGVVKLD